MPLSHLKPKSDSAVVRKMLHEIETALSFGISRESIWKTLCKEQNLKLTFEGFKKALMRARQSRNGSIEASSRFEKVGSHSAQSALETDSGKELSSATDGNTDFILRDTPKHNRIRTTGDFSKVHRMNFNEFDEKFK
ncbi:hypothetical protein [Caballeronia sp. HLA56]